MTELLDNYIHQLRFRIDTDAPPKYLNKFKKLKYEIENLNNQHFSFQIKEKCKLLINQNLNILDRFEGGLGGDNNITDKQIRYRTKPYYQNDNDILIYVQNSNIEKWTYEELDDIILSFIKVCNNYMDTKCVNGCIELINDLYEDI